MSFKYTVKDGWEGGREPKDNLCKFSKAYSPNHTNPTYDFTTVDKAGNKVRIHGKSQFRTFMKDNGLTDNFAYSEKTLKLRSRENMQHRFSEAVRKSYGEAVRRVRSRPYYDRRVCG